MESFPPERQFMKKHLSTGLILALLGSNLIIGQSYIVNTKKLEKKIHTQSKLIKQNKVDKSKLNDVIRMKSFENDDLLNRIDMINQQLDKVKKENSSLKKDNIKLKKTLQARKEVKKRRRLNMTLTFYGADCDGCSGITRTGIQVKNTIYYKGMRVIATDPRVIKLHSIVKIETDKESYIAYAADTGSAIKGNILDVLVSSERESIQHGRQHATVTIIREGK